MRNCSLTGSGEIDLFSLDQNLDRSRLQVVLTYKTAAFRCTAFGGSLTMGTLARTNPTAIELRYRTMVFV